LLHNADDARSMTSADERQFILDDDSWSPWPILPLVKRKGDLGDEDKLAFIYAANKTGVYYGSICIDASKPQCYRDFSSIDAILAEYLRL
jgi:hypothetical protein